MVILVLSEEDLSHGMETLIEFQSFFLGGFICVGEFHNGWSRCLLDIWFGRSVDKGIGRTCINGNRRTVIVVVAVAVVAANSRSRMETGRSFVGFRLTECHPT